MCALAAGSEDPLVERLLVYQASALSRLWVALVLGGAVAAILGSIYLADGLAGDALRIGFIVCAAFVPVSLMIQPIAYLESGPVRLVRGVRVLGLLVRLKISSVDPAKNVVLVEHFRGAPRQRREGWYLGVKVEDGRTAWLGYSRDHAEIEARAKPIRAWLRRCRRG